MRPEVEFNFPFEGIHAIAPDAFTFTQSNNFLRIRADYKLAAARNYSADCRIYYNTAGLPEYGAVLRRNLRDYGSVFLLDELFVAAKKAAPNAAGLVLRVNIYASPSTGVIDNAHLDFPINLIDGASDVTLPYPDESLSVSSQSFALRDQIEIFNPSHLKIFYNYDYNQEFFTGTLKNARYAYLGVVGDDRQYNYNPQIGAARGSRVRDVLHSYYPRDIIANHLSNHNYIQIGIGWLSVPTIWHTIDVDMDCKKGLFVRWEDEKENTCQYVFGVDSEAIKTKSKDTFSIAGENLQAKSVINRESNSIVKIFTGLEKREFLDIPRRLATGRNVRFLINEWTFGGITIVDPLPKVTPNFTVKSNLVNDSYILARGAIYTVTINGTFPLMYIAVYDGNNGYILNYASIYSGAGTKTIDISIPDNLTDENRYIELQYSIDGMNWSVINYGSQNAVDYDNPLPVRPSTPPRPIPDIIEPEWQDCTVSDLTITDSFDNMQNISFELTYPNKVYKI